VAAIANTSRRRAQRRIKAGYPEMFARCRETFACFRPTPDPAALSMCSGGTEASFGNSTPTRLRLWQGNFRDILIDRRPTAAVSERLRGPQIRQR